MTDSDPLAGPPGRRSVRGRLLLAFAACALLAALAGRFLGSVSPETAFHGERSFLYGVSHPDELPESRFYLQTVEARALVSLGLSPRSAAFLQSALLGLLCLGLATLAAYRIFGGRAAVVCVFAIGLSLIHLAYAVRLVGVIHATCLIAASLVLWSTKRRVWWALGGVALGLAFAHRYHAGAAAVSFALAVLVHDALEFRRVGSLRHFLRRLADRAWVGAIAAGTLYAYEVYLSGVYSSSQITRLLTHENHDSLIVHANFYWLWVVARLDPAIFLAGCAAMVLWWRCGKPCLWGDGRGEGRDESSTAFVDARVLIYWALALILFVTVFRSFSGMLRQLFPGLFLLYIVLSGVVAAVSRQVPAHRAQRYALLCLLAMVFCFGLGLDDLYSTRGTKSRPKEIRAYLEATYPDRRVRSARYWQDFLQGNRGPKMLVSRGRPPDLVVCAPRWYPIMRFEEEPNKLVRLQRRLEKQKVDDLVSLDELVYTTLIYVEPPLSAEEKQRLTAALPLRLRRAVQLGD